MKCKQNVETAIAKFYVADYIRMQLNTHEQVPLNSLNLGYSAEVILASNVPS